jgi:hypothetical protein
LDRDAEARIKEETKATLRCILLDDRHQPVPASEPCFITGKTSGCVRAVFAKAY